MPTAEWEPWYISDPAHPEHVYGVQPDLARALLADLPVMPALQKVSMARIQEGMRQQSWSWVMNYCSLQVPAYFRYEGSLLTLRTALFVDNNTAYRHYSELAGKRIAVAGRAESLLPGFAANTHYEQINSIEQGLLLLQHQRVDALLTGVDVMHWMQQRKPEWKNYPLRVLEIHSARAELCLYVHSAVDLDERKLVARKLAKMRSNGELKTILERYLGPQ